MADVLEFIRTIWPIVATVASLIATGLFFVFRSKFVEKRDFIQFLKKDEERFEVLTRKLVEAEKQLVVMPSDRHVNSLGRQIEKLNGEVKTLNVELNGVHALLARLEKPLDMMMQANMEKKG